MRSFKPLAAAAVIPLLFLPAGFAANHREAPITALDHKADITDVYAFRSYGGASATPRVGTPRTRSPSAPLLRSRISWEMRVSARLMSSASRTVRPVPAVPDDEPDALVDGAVRDTAPDLLLRLTGRVVKGCRCRPRAYTSVLQTSLRAAPLLRRVETLATLVGAHFVWLEAPTRY